MTIEEFKTRFKNDKRIVFKSSNYDLLRRLEKILLYNGWKWCCSREPVSLIDNYLIQTPFYLCCNYRLDQPKKLSFSSSGSILNIDDIIELNEEVMRVIILILKPIPNYKPKVFDKSI